MFPYHLTVVAEDSRNHFVIDVSSYMFNERLHFQMETSKPCFKRHVTATVLLKYWMLASIQTPCWRLSKHHVNDTLMNIKLHVSAVNAPFIHCLKTLKSSSLHKKDPLETLISKRALYGRVYDKTK